VGGAVEYTHIYFIRLVDFCERVKKICNFFFTYFCLVYLLSDILYFVFVSGFVGVSQSVCDNVWTIILFPV